MRKFLSTILASVISISFLGSLSVNAESEEEEKMYTFSELLDMSKEEFIALDETAEMYYYQVEMRPQLEAEAIYNINHFTDPDYSGEVPDYETLKSMYAQYNVLRGYVFCVVDLNDTEYIPYETEKCIQNLLGDSVEYTIHSPLLRGSSLFDWSFSVSIDDYYVKLADVTNDDILYLAKFEYCINQVYSEPSNISFSVELFAPRANNYGESNGDNKLTAADAAYIARKLAEQKSDELPETADFNGDGEITALDCAKIAQFLAARSMAQAEGMIS